MYSVCKWKVINEFNLVSSWGVESEKMAEPPTDNHNSYDSDSSSSTNSPYTSRPGSGSSGLIASPSPEPTATKKHVNDFSMGRILGEGAYGVVSDR